LPYGLFYDRNPTIEPGYATMKVDEQTEEQQHEKIENPGALEDALAKSQAVSHAFLNATSDLAVLLDTRGVILEVNDAVLRRVSKTRGELMGKCLFDFFPPEFKEFRKFYINIVQQTREPHRFQDEYMGLILQVCVYPILNRGGEVEKLAVFVSDNTQHRRGEELLHRYSQIFSSIHDPIAYIDKNFTFRLVNDAYLQIYQKPLEDIAGHPVEELLGDDFKGKKIDRNIELCLRGQKIQQQEWFDFPDGNRRCMYMSYYPLLARDDRVTGVILNSVDITKIKELEEELKQLSITDRLTQIYNRRKFDQALQEEIRRHNRYNTDLSIIMLDIDHFKKINDTYGHDAGDKILVELVALVKRCIRETDIFSRWGGEEFMLLLPHTTLWNAAKLAERIRLKIMSTPFTPVGTLTCSFGAAQFSVEDNEETFTRRVDEALYDSKREGRNRTTVK
jgi:diguanylate cyclase (GGDEF)-like protein/PAS domain S-box-containing protein